MIGAGIIQQWVSVLTIAATLSLGIAGRGLAASAAEVAKVAGYRGPDRHSVFEKGAHEEGSLLVYTVGSQIDPLIDAFRTKYPFLNVRTLKNDVPQLVQRTVQEYRAGVYNADAFELNDYGLQVLLHEKVLAPFWSPEVSNYDAEAIGPDNHWLMMRQDFAGLGFNTMAVSPDNAPHTYNDLLDPKWKGKLALAARPSSPTLWLGALVMSEGEDFVRKLGQQNVRLYNLGGVAVDNLVATGETPMVLDSRRSHIFTSRQSGAKVDWRALGPSYTALSGVALAAQALHPNAAMLFIDFMLSKQAQEIYRDKLGYVSMRKDVITSDAPIQKLYLSLRPNFDAEYKRWRRLADEVFRQR